MATTLEKIRALVERLSPDHQKRVLEFAQELAQIHQFTMSLPETKLPPGTPGKKLLHITLPLKDAEAMEHALADFERIDPDEY